jgi:hypothetical protein
METSLKSQASDWLKWRPDLRLVSMLSFITLGTGQMNIIMFCSKQYKDTTFITCAKSVDQDEPDA